MLKSQTINVIVSIMHTETMERLQLTLETPLVG
jgi:hypothetical protein